MLPTVGSPTRLVLPDGRTATLTLTIDPEPAKGYVPLPVVPPPPRPAAPKAVPPPVVKAVAAPRPPSRPLPPRGSLAAGADPWAALDHPAVGGSVTAFVLCYGDFPDLHRRCVDAVLRTTPRDRLELRVAGNQVCQETRDYLNGLAAAGQVAAFYDFVENRRKYPVMRELFRDRARPVRTRWLLWLDDDTMTDRDPLWLPKLAQVMATPDPTLGLVGPKYFYSLQPGQGEWLKAAPWHRGRPFRDKSGKPAPNGTRVHFASGSFWALKTECVLACDIPDARLDHNGGDWTIGEQVYQGGYAIKGFSPKKEVVNWSSVKRRGVSQKHPGL